MLGGKTTAAREADRRDLRAMLRLVAVALLIALASVAPALGDELEVEITECDPNGTVEEREACESRSENVGPSQPREETHTVTPPTAEPQPQPETHDYSLRSGTGQRTAAGDTEDTKLEYLDLQSNVEETHKPDETDAEKDHDDHDHGGTDFAKDGDILPTVSTSGGSQFAGFGSGFQFMTSDEALAQFAVPPFLVPIYVAAGRAYGVPWNVLAAINKIETDFGRIKHQVSYAGALGWMQFMPGTWRAYGVDASGDGVADPSNPVDAIYAAARYLAASGAPTEMRRAIFAYNHADWYVDQVLRTASIYGSLPGGLVAETGSLAFGRFPVVGPVSYGDDFRRAEEAGRRPVGLLINTRARATAIATQNVVVKKILLDRRLARAFRRDGRVPSHGLRPAPPRRLAFGAGRELRDDRSGASSFLKASIATALDLASTAVKPRSKARRASAAAGLPQGYERSRRRGIGVLVEDGLGNRYRYDGLRRVRPQIRPGARLRGAQRIGQLPQSKRPALLFSVRAAGGARVDPRPLVDGYRLQEAADFYHALGPAGGNPFLPDPASDTPGGVIQGSQAQLAARVLRDSGIQVYPCGRQDIARGIVDKRILTAMLYLRSAGLELTVTSLRCGHGYYTAGGSVSAHSYGAAMDIAAFNGQSVLGNQGPGSLTEQAMKLLMQLEGDARPAQLISLMNLGGPSFAMSDHHDHLHVGYQFQQAVGVGRGGNALGPVTFDGSGSDVLAGGQVSKAEERSLSRKLGSIENPEVRRDRGRGSVEVEAERRHETDAADWLARKTRPPLHASATAAGARLIDVDIPRRPRGDEAYALGVVAGAGREGWASRQTVVLAHRHGVWRIAGAPVDARGNVRNPKLRALASIRGGGGYAVGRNGSVVFLRGLAKPRIVRADVRRDLLAVDARLAGRRLEGVAVGRRGSAVALSGGRARAETVGARRALLTSVTFEAGGSALASASSTVGVDPALLYRRIASGWVPLGTELGLPDRAEVRVASVAAGRGEIWLAGAVSDARTLGTPAELPLAARLNAGGGWTTFCSGTPARAAVRELGTQKTGCDAPLAAASEVRGPAGDVAITRVGALVATRGGLHLLRNGRFQALTANPGALVSDDGLPASLRLAVSGRGMGWAVGGDGRLVRIERSGRDACGACETDELPLPHNAAASVAVAPGGERALALAGGQGAAWQDGKWAQAAGTDAAVREAAWSGTDEAWAVAETGSLLRYADGEWSAPGEDSLARGAREALTRALSGGSLIGGAAENSATVEALAFQSAEDGYAVGADGILRYDGDEWKAEDTPSEQKLVDVAASGDAVVAVGAAGTLLERGSDGWEQSRAARALVGRSGFTAVHALRDGTLVAVAGGAVIEKAREGEWHMAKLAPLGVPVAELASYRTRAGLTALALVGAGEEKVLLQGTAAGWKPLALPTGSRPVDLELDGATNELWLAAHRDHAQVAIRLPLGSIDPAGEQLERLLDANGHQVGTLGTHIQRLVTAAATDKRGKHHR